MRVSTRLYLPTLLWALVTAVGLLFPGPEMPDTERSTSWIPVLAHFVVCGVLAFLLYRSLILTRGSRPSWAAVFAVCFLYGGLLELAQLWVPGRDWEVGDLVMNGLGIAVALLAARRLYSSDSRISPSMS